MQRRPFILSSLCGLLMNQATASSFADSMLRLEAAAEILQRSVKEGQIRAAVIVARVGENRIERAYGSAGLESAFLLGSISKPICIAALMTLFDQGAFHLTDPVQKYLPEFKGAGRDEVTVQHLLTHVSGLPDQLTSNAELRKSNAPLAAFVEAAMRVPLGFEPGTKYEYSSMAILLAAEIAQRLSGKNFLKLVEEKVFQPLGMKHSAIGVGRLGLEATVQVQIEHAAIEAGGGDPTAKLWDWNSRYWRELGAPWGGVHASASDVATFLDAFIHIDERFLSTATANLMIRNHNPTSLIPRGLGFALGPLISKKCHASAFGHTGSTGTIAFVDKSRDTSCVVLTSLPGQAMQPHPRELAAECL